MIGAGGPPPVDFPSEIGLPFLKGIFPTYNLILLFLSFFFIALKACK